MQNINHQANHSRNAIEVRDLSFSYGGHEVLSHISLDIHEGDYIGIVGPNGAGKTTFLRIILGLLKPTFGDVRILGDKVSYVPQKAINFDQNFPATVWDIVSMGLREKVSQTARVTEIQNALQHVGMLECKDRRIGDLSGGQQQRVFIARALVSHPRIILLDEPTTGIDSAMQDEFYALLKDLNERLGLTLVLVSHDIERVVREVMHVACINTTLEFHVSPQQYYEHHHA